MLRCVFGLDIVLENEFKRCVYLNTNTNALRWSQNLSFGWEVLHGKPCLRLDNSVYTLKYMFWLHNLLQK